MDRQEGYYWVKRKGEFIIGHYDSRIPNPWGLFGYTSSFKDSDFEHINEIRIKEPGELPD